MRCPDCDRTLVTLEYYYDTEFVCEECDFYVPRGAD